MNVSDLRSILRYVPKFRKRIFVICLDGEVVASENFGNVLLDLAVLRSLNIQFLLVHGAGQQMREMAERRGVELTDSEGTGRTDDATLEVAVDASTRLLNEILQGLTSVDLRGASANIITAYPLGVIGGEDREHTGRIKKVDTRCMAMFLKENIIPVVSPVGFDGEGRYYRLSADEVAVALAREVKAAKIIYLADAELCDREGRPVRQMSVTGAEEFLKRSAGWLDSGLEAKVRHGAAACREGTVERVHILPGESDEALLREIFSSEGIGAMIHADAYQNIRQATPGDVDALMGLIQESVLNAELVRRERDDVLAHLADYWLLEVDGVLVGCVALYLYGEAGAGELGCLYVRASQANKGHGRTLMAFTEQRARDVGLRRLFALSTQAYAYLRSKGGFTEIGPEELPPARLERYQASGRNSKVLVKDLQT